MSENDNSSHLGLGLIFDPFYSNETYSSLQSENSSSTVQPMQCYATVTYGGRLRTLRLIVEVLLIPLIAVFGLAGNTVSIAVLRRMRSTTSFLLQALAVADSLFLLTCLEFQFLSTLHFYLPSFRAAFPRFAYLQLVVWPLAGMAQMSAVWLVVLVTGERYLAVCHPLRVKRSATMTKTRVAVGIVFLGAVLFNIPTAFDLETVIVKCDDLLTEELQVSASQLAHNHPYQLVYKTILCFVFRTALPLSMVIYFNVRLLRAVRASANISKHGSHKMTSALSTSSSSPGNELNRVIISVVAVFVFCETPDVVYRIMRTVKFYVPSFPLDWLQMLSVATMTNFLLTVNSSVNVIIYVATGTKFRRVMMRQLCSSSQDGDGRRPVPV